MVSVPGIPLAIYFPESRFYLTDSIGKKIRVANAIISELKLENAEAEQVRAEEVKAKFTFAVSRAVAEMPKIYGWAKDKIMKNKKGEDGNGLICLKGGDLTEELRPFRGKAEVISLADYFEEEYFNDKKAVYIRFN